MNMPNYHKTKKKLGWSQLCYISQELNLSTYPVVIKKRTLQRAAVYAIKFRME